MYKIPQHNFKCYIFSHTLILRTYDCVTLMFESTTKINMITHN